MPDLDLRVVRYFVVLAEHGHFGRAADALHLAQPSLSRQIRRLETDVGAALFRRTPQGAVLTDVGVAFLEPARDLLEGAERGLAAARAARLVQGPPSLRVGYVGDLVVTPDVAELRRARPDAVVTSAHLDWDAMPGALLGPRREDRCDVVMARFPFAVEGLSTAVLHTEPRSLMVPVGHRLARRSAVTLDDFTDEPLVRFPDAAYSAFWRIDPRPDGRPAPDGPLVADYVDKREYVAAGEALSLVPPGGSATGGRSDLVLVPVEGVAPSRVVLAWRRGEEAAAGSLVGAYLAVARARFAVGRAALGEPVGA